MHSKEGKQEESRLTRLLEQNPDSPLLEMPETGPSGYILRYLTEVGISSSGGFGITPITWTEIYSWSELMQIDITSWEATLIMQLSRTFVSKYNEFDKKNVSAPYLFEEFDREAASKAIGFKLMQLASKFNKRVKYD